MYTVFGECSYHWCSMHGRLSDLLAPVACSAYLVTGDNIVSLLLSTASLVPVQMSIVMSSGALLTNVCFLLIVRLMSKWTRLSPCFLYVRSTDR